MNTMFVEVDYKKKIVYYFLSSQERDNVIFRDSLKPEYAIWRNRGYITCVFLSGNEDLKENTADLLRHNLELMAKKSIEEKKMGALQNV